MKKSADARRPEMSQATRHGGRHDRIEESTDTMEQQKQPHARAFDLPGWPCPPRVRDIPNRAESWGRIGVLSKQGGLAVAHDELGFLWVNGDTVPQFSIPGVDDPASVNPGALVFWTESGIGLWVHPKSMRFLPSISRLDMTPDQWMPVNEVYAEWPPFVKGMAQA